MELKRTKKRADKTEYHKRLFSIQGWIIEGVQSFLIVRQILNNDWCQSERHAKRMLADARRLWIDVEEGDIDQKRKIKVAELQQMKRNLKPEYKSTPGGLRALIAVDKEIILLEGLRKPTKVSVTDSEGNDLPTVIPEIKVYLSGPELARSEEHKS
jgi:hypothetical protein